MFRDISQTSQLTSANYCSNHVTQWDPFTFCASDVGHINQGNEHELQHRGRGSNRYEYDNAVREEVAKAEYDNLETTQRPLPNTPTVYEELRKPR